MVLVGEMKGKQGVLKQVDLGMGFGEIQIDNNTTLRLSFNHFSKY
jgi:hypothetical protein